MLKKIRLQNISEMELSYNKLESNMKDMKKSLSKFKKLLPEFNKLLEYYESEQRRSDYDDSSTWKLKIEWPHWILGEDTIYDYYQNQRQLCLDLIKTATKYLEK